LIPWVNARLLETQFYPKKSDLSIALAARADFYVKIWSDFTISNRDDLRVAGVNPAGSPFFQAMNT
jgi:hypothetical protein